MRSLTRNIDRLARMPHQPRAGEYGMVTPRPGPTLSRATAPAPAQATASDRDANT
jgi:hypothetical protein